ncbi:AAA family ATPase [Streptomyces hirsutus]|uniref:AAA family ATPase n=1 Tax=Streptomyces hirsutus TaxID=35620 RepID=UPI00362F16C5
MKHNDLFKGLQFLVISGKRNSQDKLHMQPRGIIGASALATLKPEKERPELLFAPFPMTVDDAMPSIARAGDGGCLVWTDVDHSLTREQRGLAEELGAWLLASGTPGRRQVFIRLDSATPAHHVEALNRALCEKLGGDPSKISRAAIMRLAGGFNTKGGERRRARFVHQSERVWSAPELAQKLGTELPDTDTRDTVSEMPTGPLKPEEPAKRNRRAEWALDTANSKYESGNQTNRDGVLWGLYKDLARPVSQKVKGVSGAGVTDGSHLLWYALRCEAAKHDANWVAADVKRFLRSKEYAAFTEAAEAETAGVRDEPAVTSADDEPVKQEKEVKPRRRKSRFLTRQELRERPEPKWLIERLLPEYGIGQLFGPTYGGKTYAAIDLAMRLCTGMSHWIGHTVHVKGPVFYVLMEGGFDFAKRLDAWELKYGRTSDELYVMVEEELNLNDPESLEQLAQDITAVSSTPRLLVIDTQSLAIQGVDENDNTGMNEVMQKLKRLSKLLGCFVLLVHHTGHANEERGRGASSQPAALDVIIRVNGSESKGRKIAAPKVKAAREIGDLDFRLEEQKNKWPAFVEMTGAEVVEKLMTNEDKIVRYLQWNGPASPPQIAEGLGDTIADSTVRNACAAMADPNKCMKGETPRLVVVKSVGRSKFYDVPQDQKVPMPELGSHDSPET